MGTDVVAPLETAVSAEETKKKIDKPSDEISVAMTIMSPFVATSKEFHWPSIYEEIDEMHEACILAYPIADLRALAREGKLKNDCVSKLPLSSVQCVDAIAGNLDAFRKTEPTKPEDNGEIEAKHCEGKVAVTNNTDTPVATEATVANDTADAKNPDQASAIATFASRFCTPALTGSNVDADARDPENASVIAMSASRFCQPAPSTAKEGASSGTSTDESYAVRLDALKALHARQLQAKSEGKPFAVTHASYIAFSDDSTNDEFAYAVSVDKNRKRVTICFRGSASETNWATSKTWMKSMRNPAARRPDQPQEVKIHSKIFDCLFSPSSSGVKGPKGVILNEYQAVLQKSVLMELRRNPGFKLYITGHSLGAAIATLFAFESAAAADSIIPKPVTCVSIGSPYVGDSSFREAHQWLERQGKLRHIRVSNHQDLVTTVPVVSFTLNVREAAEANVGTPFKHVGMNIRLRGDGNEQDGSSYEVEYPKVSDSLLETYKDEIERGWRNSFLANLSTNPVDYWTWPWHGKCAYNDRIQKSKASLEKLHLDALYKSEDVVGDLVGQI